MEHEHKWIWVEEVVSGTDPVGVSYADKFACECGETKMEFSHHVSGA